MNNFTLPTRTKIITRQFHSDPDNGQLALGIIRLDDIPDNFHFGPEQFYSCTIVLNNGIPLSDMNYHQAMLKPGDVIQAFPASCPEAASGLPLQFAKDLADMTPETAAGTCVFYIRFGSLTYQALSAAGLLLKAPVFHFNPATWATNWIRQLIQELETATPETLSDVYLNMQKFVIQIHQSVLSTTARKRQIVESGKQLLYQKCLEGVSLEEAAESLGLTYENFRKIFKEGTGMSPLQYALDCKFHYAQRHLSDGKSVKETAALTGYADPYIFSKQFKKYTGFPPSHFKKKG